MSKFVVNVGIDIKDEFLEVGTVIEDSKLPKKSLKWLKDQNIIEKYDENKEKIRARNEKGHYIADNPDTPENEAWYDKQEEEE